MRKNIYLYLFLFVLLLILFQYMNQKKIFERQENKIEELRERANKAEDSLEVLSLENHNLNYFTLQGNENAMTYLERLGYEAADVETLISEISDSRDWFLCLSHGTKMEKDFRSRAPLLGRNSSTIP